MHIVEDEIDEVHYLDLILSLEDAKKITRNEMVSGSVSIKRRRFYIGIRLQGEWDEEEIEEEYEE